MRHSKLLSLYQQLTKSERRQFKKWVHSPMHNEHEGVQRLFAFVESRAPWTAHNLAKAEAWQQVFPKRPYDDGHWRYLMSLSLGVLLDFVGYVQQQQTPVEQQRAVLAFLLDRQLLDLTKQPLKKAQRLLAQQPANATYHLQQYQLERLKFDLQGTQDRSRSTNIKHILQHATLFFFQTTLRHACIARSHQNLNKTDYDLTALPLVLQTIENHWERYQDAQVLMLYYHGYYTLLEQEKSFLALQDSWEKLNDRLADREKRELLLLGINYCIKQLNSGRQDYIRKAFEWYRTGLERGLLLEEGQLSLFAYSNMVALGINLKEFDWVEHFLEQYTSYLPSAQQAHYQHYNRAKLAFAKSDFSTAMQLLSTVEYDDVLLNISAKVLLLKIYYQEQTWDALEALLNSFRIFLSRKKLLSYHKKNYQNLIALTKSLVYLSSDKKAVQQLRQRIESTEPLTERAWLLEQL
jgi:hypothetical protein